MTDATDGVGAAPVVGAAEEALLRGPDVGRDVPLGVPGLIRRWSTAAPDTVALVDTAGTVSYAELERRSNAVARRLVQAGVAPGDVVAVAVPRSSELVVALLGALKAGAPYLPLSLEDPVARRTQLMRQSGARHVLVAPGQEGVLDDPRSVDFVEVDAPEEEPASDPQPLLARGPEHPAYVLYTSGSTGDPKGVVVPGAALCNRLLWMVEAYGFGPGDRTLQKTPATFDVSGWELWAPLISGGRVVLPPPGAHRDPGELVTWIRDQRVTLCHFVPSMLAEFLRWPGAGDCTTLRAVFCSGEALPVDLVRRFAATLPARLHNLYGPTEAAIDVTYWPAPEDPRDLGRVLIGRPVDNCTLVVVDDELRPVPAGRVGQLAIGGPVLATGYLHRPDLTERSFVPAPAWSGVPRLYLTGDLVRRLGDDLEYVGRRDEQVKVRGQRVELAEVESFLRGQPEVADAAAVAVAPSGSTTLVAFVVPAHHVDDAAALAERLADRARAALPEAFVPTVVVTAGPLPLSTSGKRDRRLLRERAGEVLGERAVPAASTAPTGDDLLDLWVEALGRSCEDPERGFVAAGGHSLGAARLAGGILARWGVRIPLADLLRQDLSLADLRRRLDGVPVRPAPRVPRRADPTTAPVTADQRRLLLWSRLYPDVPAYNVVGILDVAGAVDGAALERALLRVVARHETLRTTFQDDGASAVAHVLPEAPLTVEVRVAGGRSWGDEVQQFAGELGADPFVPDVLPRLRAGLLRGGPRSAVCVVLDHLVSDQHSLDLVLAELAIWYGRETGAPEQEAVPPDPPQYGDIVAARRAAPGGDQADDDLRFWTERLGDAPTSSDLPFRHPRPARPSFTGGAVAADLDAQVTARLVEFAGAHGTTPAMTVLTAYARTLAAWTGDDDVVIGVPMSGRELADELDAVGFFVHTVPVRLRVSPATPDDELLGSVADTVLEAAEHAAVPFDDMVAALGRPRDLSTNPVFQVWFNDLSRAEPPAAFGGHPAVAVDPPAWALFDLNLYLSRTADGRFRLRLVYAADLWDDAPAEQFLRQCRDRLVELVLGRGSSPGRPEVPSAEGRVRTCGDLVAAVLIHGREHPERTALVTQGRPLSYGDLAAQVHAAAARAGAVHEGRMVAVRAVRDAALAAHVLGCWWAGRPFLLLPDDAPDAWIDAALERSGAVLLPGSGAGRSAAPGTELPLLSPAPAPAVPLRPGAAGHALTTSGTSGQPAVVELPAETLPEALDCYAAALALGPDDVFCFTTPPAHDPVFRDLLLPLLLGARVHVPTREQAADPAALVALLADSGATVLHATPGQLRLLAAAAAAHGRTLPRLLHVVLHGAPADATAVEAGRVMAPAAEFLDLYGTTETPQASMLYRLAGPGLAPGTTAEIRLPHRVTYVAAPDGSEVRPGEVGELIVVGRGLALAYLGEAERRAPRPLAGVPGAAMYRTGDFARRGLEGGVQLLGRRNRQVSLHGNRVELDGVERVLAAAPGVEACAVTVDPLQPDALLAWVVPSSPTWRADLETWARDHLPAAARPRRHVALEALPLTSRGKVDHRALRVQPATTAPTGLVADPGPARQVADLVVERMRELLPDADVDVHTNFFDAGLASLGLARLHQQLSGADGLSLALSDMFRFPTPLALAGHLASVDASGSPPAATPAPRRRGGPPGGELAARRAARRRLGTS